MRYIEIITYICKYIGTMKYTPSDTLLFIIAQELKIRRLFIGLQKAGFDDCYFEPHLDKLIFAELGLDDGRDETLELYSEIIEKRCRKIEPNQESIMKGAL